MSTVRPLTKARILRLCLYLHAALTGPDSVAPQGEGSSSGHVLSMGGAQADSQPRLWHQTCVERHSSTGKYFFNGPTLCDVKFNSEHKQRHRGSINYCVSCMMPTGLVPYPSCGC